MDPLNIPAKFEIRSFSRSWDNRGYPKKIGQFLDTPMLPFLQNFSQDFFGWTPYYLRSGKSYGFQIWPVHSGGPSEQKPIKNFRQNRAWAYPGTAQFFRILPIISGTGKATNFKFCKHIYGLNRDKCPLQILRKVAIGVVRHSRKFSGHPYIWRIARSSLR